MALTNYIDGQIATGGHKIVWGRWVYSSSDTSGDVKTGLGIVQSFQCTETKSNAVDTESVVINETFPLANVDGTVSIVYNASTSGYWRAIGQ